MATPTEESFHLFSKLPPELRLRIWDLNLPTSRLIPIHCLTPLTSSKYQQAHQTQQQGQPQHQQQLSGCTSPAPIPANLHAVSESRAHALTRYQPSLSFAHTPSSLLIDPRADVIYFPPLPGYMASAANFHTCLTLCSPLDLAEVERLAIHEDVFSTGIGTDPDAGEEWYYSGLAVERTMEVLSMVRERLTGVGECVFVSRRAAGRRERLGCQVRCAMGDLGWEGPTWSVVEEP